ncbi:MAG: hydantoinase/oxoprolinase family protein [Desulfitobacteriaceae bacterium]
MERRAIRVGIDVGGTHTKAVALDNSTHEILGKASVMTTHSDALGVAAGVIQAFKKCLAENNISPEEVIFIAHSTTQATNALLEGDVAHVGVFGIGKGGLEGFLAKRNTMVKDIALGTGKSIKVSHVYLKTSEMKEAVIEKTIQELKNMDAKVIVASQAFGVDGAKEEEIVHDTAVKMEIACSVASDISKLYGLAIRTRTAVINASILPKMLETANSTEESVRKTGITVPLMIMRGDGGVMEVVEIKKRPVLTMLSGPAASVIGALMYLRASNGIYFEVGGTSTNIGVIKNGRPTVDYSIVGGHRTYINSLDVRVLGVAGGSMVRVSGKKIVDVGPRSAHIAGLSYAAFTPEEDIVDPQVEFIRPRKDDPDDYVAILLQSGKRITITNTCAANVLGLVESQYFAHGNRNSCYKAIAPLAKMLGLSVEETAREILKKSCSKITGVIEELALRYKLEKEQMVLVGVGGGAAALLPFTAEIMSLQYSIPENAEVISSIGVALAMVRDVVERIITNPSTEDIARIKREAKDLAINSGAVPESVEVHIEIDTQTQKVRAIALGSTEVRTTDLLKECTIEEARGIAAQSMSIPDSQIKLEENNGHLYVFSFNKNDKNQLRIVDKKGFIKIQRRDGLVKRVAVDSIHEELKNMWSQCNVYARDMVLTPDIYILMGSRMLDYSGIESYEQIEKVLSTEISDADAQDQIILVGAKNDM